MANGSAFSISSFQRFGLFLALLLGLFAFRGHAQTLPPRISAYPPEQYEAHGQVFCTVSLSGGRRAFGTGSKVLVYNGESFVPVPVGEGKPAFSLDLSSNGLLFVGGNSLMGVIAPDSTGRLSFRSLQHLLPDSLRNFGNIWDTRCDGDGGVYFRTERHLFYHQGDSVKVIRPENRFFRIFHPTDRPVVQDRDRGLFALSGTDKSFLEGSDSLVQGKDIRSILPAAERNSGKWTVFTSTKGLYRYAPSTGKVTRMGDAGEGGRHRELREARINTATRLDPSSNPYGAAYAVGTKLDGIYLIGPGGRILLHLGRESGIPTKGIWQLRTDRGGNVWAATNNGIALLHTGLPFMLAQEGKSFNGVINDISREPPSDRGESGDGSPLFLATSQGAWSWHQEEERFSILEGSEGQCMGLSPFSSKDRPSRMMIAHIRKGLLSAPSGPERKRGRSSVDRLAEDHADAIVGLETPQGPGVLLGGREGLHLLQAPQTDKDNWEKRFSGKGIPEEIVSVGFDPMESEPDSFRLWAGISTKGLLSVTSDSTFSSPVITRYDTTDGLPEGIVRVFPDPSDEEKGVVFGTIDGLYKFKDGEFLPSCRLGSIFCNGSRQVFRLEKGTDGELWVIDAMGSELKHLIPKEDGYRIDSAIFRALDLGGIRAILPEKERTWIGGEQGLARYDPKVKLDPGRNWHCRLSQVKGSGDSLLFGGTFFKKKGSGQSAASEGSPSDGSIGSISKVERVPLEEQPEGMLPVLPYSKNRMEFIYAASFPTRQEAVQYRYKLSGFDPSWSEWTKETKKEYTNLPEGSYTFRVKARNIYLKESTTAQYRFRILPPWYRTWTAYGGYTIAGMGFVGFLLWLNSRRLRAQKERLERTVEERTYEIRRQKEETEKQKEEVEKQREISEERREKIEEAHQEITQSIDYAQKIQYALLQSEEYVSSHLPEHFILFKPQSQVSGDFYWAQEHKGSFYIAAVDCTGHGVPGAFMSMLGISQLNEIMNTDEVLTPGYILTDLRDRVVRELSGSDPESAAKDGMDAAMVRIPIANANSKGEEEEDLEIQFAGAQNPLYVVRKGIAEEPPSASMEFQGEALDGDPVKPFKKSADGIEIKGDGQPVGYDEYAKDAFTTVRLSLRKDDMLYFFSDGYADQFGGPKGKKFRYGPFKQLLASLHEKPLEEQKAELDRTFEDWKAESDQEQVDDVVVIGLRL